MQVERNAETLAGVFCISFNLHLVIDQNVCLLQRLLTVGFTVTLYVCLLQRLLTVCFTVTLYGTYPLLCQPQRLCEVLVHRSVRVHRLLQDS